MIRLGTSSVGTRRALIFAGGMIMLCGAFFSAPAETQNQADEVKAAFVFNFLKFLEWPGSQSKAVDGQWTIAVLSGDDLYEVFQRLSGKRAEGWPIRVLRASSADDAVAGHVLVVSREKTDLLSEAVKKLSGKPVLVIADTPEGEGMGAAISFHLKENRVRFSINREALDRAGLKASSHLLKLAEAAEKP